jgi:hypothetical protein
MGLGRTIPVVREALRDLTLGQRALNIWIFVVDIAEEIILGLDTPAGLPRDSGRGTPWVTTGQDEVPVREAPTASVLTRSGPTESQSNRRPVCWQCGETCPQEGEPWREKLRG